MKSKKNAAKGETTLKLLNGSIRVILIIGMILYICFYLVPAFYNAPIEYNNRSTGNK
ncbi:hypothetical protein [Pedobacter antarcticus]|uniref:hypothetical protein n=1 Tax=Pedobacter antarcticus TaxID=34086 RepID=UPI00088A7971|nr:hypothetical protein [Pedobacter antarcticus]SDM39706.1 hypothetical protein SAMN04488084_106143 [Pedobacter antarcticus]